MFPYHLVLIDDLYIITITPTLVSTGPISVKHFQNRNLPYSVISQFESLFTKQLNSVNQIGELQAKGKNTLVRYERAAFLANFIFAEEKRNSSTLSGKERRVKYLKKRINGGSGAGDEGSWQEGSLPAPWSSSWLSS